MGLPGAGREQLRGDRELFNSVRKEFVLQSASTDSIHEDLGLLEEAGIKLRSLGWWKCLCPRQGVELDGL